MTSGTKGSYPVPSGVKSAARRGLELHAEYGRGGTSVGMGTARKLVSSASVSTETVRHIAAYFPRHAGDNLSQTGTGDTPASNGYIAWLLWGGNAGRSWSTRIRDQLEKSED